MKRILMIVPLVLVTVLFSGCSLPGSLGSPKNEMLNATFIKSEDAGVAWNPKIKIDDKKTIAGINVLSMAVHPQDAKIIHLGSESSGLFVTKDSGDSWSHVAYPDKAYGLVFDPNNPSIMYGSGVLNGRAKIFKRLSEQEEWKEIYTEPAEGTAISSLAIDKNNSQVIYAGTSEGVIIKTTDGGQTWVNLKKADGPIIGIGFNSANSSNVFFGVFQIGVLETRNAGASIENITEKIDTTSSTNSVYTLVADPYFAGVVYVGTDSGIFRRSGGDSWSKLNLIASSQAFPVRSIAINPKNSNEIMYSSAKALYKSIDGGAKWSTFQLDTAKEISVIKYDPTDSAKIYAGLRSF